MRWNRGPNAAAETPSTGQPGVARGDEREPVAPGARGVGTLRFGERLFTRSSTRQNIFPAELANRVTVKSYPGGHMRRTRTTRLGISSELDVAAFVQAATR